MPFQKQIIDDYCLGRIKLPPSVAAKRQKTYFYTGNASILSASSGRIDISMDADSYFLVEGISITYNTAITSIGTSTIQFTDNTYSQTWSNIPVLVGDVSSPQGFNYHKLPYPNMLTPSSTLSALIVNNGNATGTFVVTLIGRKFYDVTDEEMTLLKRRFWYQYASTFTITNGTSNSVQTLQILNDSDFMLRNIVSRSFYIAAPTTSNVLTFNVRDTSADRNFFSAALDYRAAVGDYTQASGNDQITLTQPMFIGRNSVLQITVSNTSGSDLNNQVIVFEGARVYNNQ